MYAIRSYYAREKSVCDHVTLAWLQTQVPVPKDAKVVFRKEQGGLCEAVLSIEGGLAPVYAGKDFIVAGQLYKNGVSITRRITSYNVCYTKLLRLAQTSGGYNF